MTGTQHASVRRKALRTIPMSTCAFCGDRHIAGPNYLAHRMTSSRMRTVKVCTGCVHDARDAGYYVTERESASKSPWRPATIRG
jgi:hypothetical protein